MIFNMHKIIGFLLTIFVVSSCEMIDYHPYDTNIHGERNINAKNIQRIEQATAGKDSIRFVVISDTQRRYNDTKKIVNHINAQPNIDFVVHCGDLTDFGMTNEFEWMRDELSRLNPPYVVILGNHDCLGTGRDVFRTMFGPFNDSFNAGNTHFLLVNSNGLEFDITQVPNVPFIKSNEALIPDSIEHTIVAMHAAPQSDQFLPANDQAFREAIMNYPPVIFGLGGHIHRPTVLHPEDSPFPYYIVGCAEILTYFIFTIHADGSYTYEEVWI